MKCEICKAIEKLGLDPATHKQWMCADAKSPKRALKSTQVGIHHFCQEKIMNFRAKWQHAGRMLYQRAHYVTLGL